MTFPCSSVMYNSVTSEELTAFVLIKQLHNQ